jgi:hypothetical protein
MLHLIWDIRIELAKVNKRRIHTGRYDRRNTRIRKTGVVCATGIHGRRKSHEWQNGNGSGVDDDRKAKKERRVKMKTGE